MNYLDSPDLPNPGKFSIPSHVMTPERFDSVSTLSPVSLHGEAQKLDRETLEALPEVLLLNTTELEEYIAELRGSNDYMPSFETLSEVLTAVPVLWDDISSNVYEWLDETVMSGIQSALGFCESQDTELTTAMQHAYNDAVMNSVSYCEHLRDYLVMMKIPFVNGICVYNYMGNKAGSMVLKRRTYDELTDLLY